MQVEQETFKLRHLAVLRPVDLCQPVDGRDPFFDRLQLLRRHAVALVDYDDIGVGDLQMCGRHMQSLMLWIRGLLVQAQEYILRINKRDDTIQVNRTTQAIIDPKEGSEIARVGETGCLQEDVVKGASSRHEGFDCVDTGVFDGAADTAVG